MAYQVNENKINGRYLEQQEIRRIEAERRAEEERKAEEKRQQEFEASIFSKADNDFSVFSADENIFGGYFDQIRGYGFMYKMPGYLQIDNEGNVSLMSSNCPGWGDGLDTLTDAHYDAVSSTLSYYMVYSGIP